MNVLALLLLLSSLHAPSFAGRLTFGPKGELSLRRTSEGYAGTWGSTVVDGRVGSDGVLHLTSSKRPFGTVERRPEGFVLTLAGETSPAIASVLLPPDGSMRGPKLPQVIVPILPGASVGEVRLGQTTNDLLKLGAVRPHPSGQFNDAVQVLGPYTLTFSSGRVSAIEVTPAESDLGLILPWMPISSGTTLELVAKAAKACGAIEHHEGGSVLKCEGLIAKAAPSCAGRDAAGVCTAWEPTKPTLSLQVVPSSRH